MKNILYSVADICTLTGVTRKTLFYYDKIGMLKPTAVKGVQHRKQYNAERLERLKMILNYRKVGLTISEIKKVLDDPKEDPILIFNDALRRLELQVHQDKKQIDALKKIIEEFS